MNGETKTILLVEKNASLEKLAHRALKYEELNGGAIQIADCASSLFSTLSNDCFACVVIDLDTDETLARLVRRELSAQKFKSPLFLISSNPDDIRLSLGESWGRVDVQPRSVLRDGYFEKCLIGLMRSFVLLGGMKKADDSAAISTQLLGLIAHEIRVPLETLRFTQKTLLGFELGENARRVVINSERTVSYLCEYISNFIEAARFEKGAAVADQEEFLVYSVVTEVIELLWPHAKIKDIKLSLNAQIDQQLKVKGDRKRIRHILINLLSNAIRYTDHGAVSVSVYANRQLTFIIRDTGVGMSSKRLSDVFYAKSEENISRTGGTHSGGLGFGVALSRKMIALIEGEIVVKSKVNAGTIVKISLPLSLADTAKPEWLTMRKMSSLNELVT